MLSAAALSNLGDGIRAAALPLLAASLTSNPTLIAGVMVAGQLPWLLFGLTAGAIIDRTDRRRLIAVVDAARVVLIGALVAAVAFDLSSLPLIYLVAFACGIGETLRDTAASTLVPAIVPEQRLDDANGRLINAEIVGNELVGPPLGSYLFGVAMVLPFAVNGGALAVAVMLVLTLPNVFLPADRAGDERPTTLWQDMAHGVRWLFRHRQLRVVAVVGAVFALTDSAWFAVLVLYVVQVLSLPPTAFGVLLGVGAVGGLVGGFLASRITQRFGTTSTLLSALLIGAAAQLVLGVTSNAVVAGTALTFSSFAFAVWNVVSLTLRQRLTPPELHGRLIGAYRTLLMGVVPLGALAGGLLATAFGLRVAFLAGVPLLLLAAVLGARVLRAPA
jgi:MFS family permease